MEHKYPIGAAWESKNNAGDIRRVWLFDISSYGFEIWRWSFCYSDGSGLESDWCLTKRTCVENCRSGLRRRSGFSKFKRINDEEI